MKLLPPYQFAIALVVMIVLHVSGFSPLMIQDEVLSLLGVVITLSGMVLLLAGANLFRGVGTPIRPFETTTSIVTDGVFRWTRNPMYLGMLMMLFGIAVLLGSLLPFLVIPFFWWILHTQFVLKEEEFLEELFGGEYRAYRFRVRRWI